LEVGHQRVGDFYFQVALLQIDECLEPSAINLNRSAWNGRVAVDLGQIVQIT